MVVKGMDSSCLQGLFHLPGGGVDDLAFSHIAIVDEISKILIKGLFCNDDVIVKQTVNGSIENIGDMHKSGEADLGFSAFDMTHVRGR